MKRSMQQSVLLVLSAITCVLLFSGATWSIYLPTFGQDCPKSVGVAGNGTATANAMVTVKITNSLGTTVHNDGQVAAQGPYPPPAPQDQGPWSINVAPPARAPYNGSWPVGVAAYFLFDDDDVKDSKAIDFTAM